MPEVLVTLGDEREGRRRIGHLKELNKHISTLGLKNMD